MRTIPTRNHSSLFLILVFNPRDLYFLGVLKNNNNKCVRYPVCSLNPVKQYYTKNSDSSFTHHSPLPVLQPTAFHKSRVIHTSKHSHFIRCKNGVLNFITVRHSLHKCRGILILKILKIIYHNVVQIAQH